MREGTYTFYIIEERIVAETKNGQPDGPMFPYDGEDRFGNFHYAPHEHVAEPGNHHGKPISPKSKAEMDEIAQISYFAWHGWWTLKYAIRGLRRVLEAYEQGAFHYRSDSYHRDKITTRLELEFRLSKITVSKKIEPVDIKEVVKAI